MVSESGALLATAQEGGLSANPCAFLMQKTGSVRPEILVK